MPQLIEDRDDLFDAIAADKVRRSEQRERIILVLPTIATEVTAALLVADLPIPIFFTVRGADESMLMFGTPLDPNDQDWSRACQLIRDIVEKNIGVENLTTRYVACVAAGTAMGAPADTVETELPFDQPTRLALDR